MANNDILVTLRADMKELQSAFNSLQNNLAGATQGTNSLHNTLQKIGKIAGIAVISKQLLNLGKDVVTTGADFESSMSKVKAISGATGEDFNKLTNLAKELGSTTSKSASEASEGMQYLAMAGWDTQQIMSGLPAILNLSVASGSQLAVVSDIVSDAMTGFGMSAEQAGHFTDVLAYASSSANVSVETLGESFKYVAPLAGTTNQSFEMLTTAISKMGDAGIKGSEAGTALRAILNRMASGNTECAKAFEKLGVEIYGVDGKMKDISVIIDEVTRATNGMSDADKNAIYSKIAGTEALSAFNVLLDVGGEGLRQYSNELVNADGSAQAMADTMQDNLNGSLTALSSKLEGIKIAIYDKLKEPLKNAVDGVIEAIDWVCSLGDTFERNKGTIIAFGTAFGILLTGITAFTVYLKSGAIISAFTGLGSTIMTVTKTMLALNTAFLTCPVTWIAMGIAGLVAVGVLLWKNWDTIKAKCIEVWGAIKDWILDTWSSITAKCSEIWGSVKDFFSNLWEGIKNVAIAVWTAIKDFFVSIWEGIVGIFQAVWERIGGIVTTYVTIVYAIVKGVFDALMIVVAVVWTAISTVIMTVWEVIKTVVSTAVNIVKTVIMTVFEAIKAYITTVVNFWKTIISTAWEAIKSVVSVAVNAIKNVITTVFNAIKSFISSVMNAIHSVVSSIWNGIKNITSSVWEAIKTAVITPANAIKNGVTSAFEGLKNSVLGIWNGIKSGIAGCVNGIIRCVNGMINGLNKFSFEVPDWVPMMGGKSFGFNIPSIPEVSWHAKGGIFTKPTVIGNHGFGEAGKEAILPLNKLPELIGIDKQQQLIEKILAEETGKGNTVINIEHFENTREQDIEQLAKELEYYRQKYSYGKGVR